MNLFFTNGTARQHQWVNDALARCTYPFDLLHVNVAVRFMSATDCNVPHVYMCTAGVPGFYSIQIEPWADDPRDPNNQGLADPAAQLHEFFIDSFIHELGHVVQYELILGAKVDQLCRCFTHIPDGRRGTSADYRGNEGTLTRWADFIVEATSEYFRLAFLSEPQIYWNRSNWFLSEADYLTAFALLTPGGYQYGPPVDCAVSVSLLDGDVVTVDGPPDQDVPLQRFSAFYPDASDLSNVAAEPGWVWDFICSVSDVESGAEQILQPGPWSPPPAAGGNLVSLRGGGGLEEPGGSPLPVMDTTLDGGVSGPFGVDILHDSAQPWTHFPYGQSLGGDLAARSAWLATRAVTYDWTLPPGHDWGVVELGVTGQDVEPPVSLAAISGTAWRSYDAASNLLTPPIDDGDTVADPPRSSGPPPWMLTDPPQPITGNGPFFDHSPPVPLDNGWLSALVITSEVNWHSHGVLGGSVAYLGVSEESIILPSTGLVLPPSAPSEAGTTITSSGVRPTSETADWQNAPIAAHNLGFSYPAAAHRHRESFTRLWTGPNTDADILTQAALRVRFFPVLTVGGAPPPPYPKQPHAPSSMKVGPGLRGQVAIPAVSGLLGSGQSTGASTAPTVQTSRPRGSNASPGLRGQRQLSR